MAETNRSIDELLTAMQTQLIFQEDTLQAVNDAVASQQQEILVLRRQVELLKQRQDELAVRDEVTRADMPANEKPPHY